MGLREYLAVKLKHAKEQSMVKVDGNTITINGNTVVNGDIYWWRLEYFCKWG